MCENAREAQERTDQHGTFSLLLSNLQLSLSNPPDLVRVDYSSCCAMANRGIRYDPLRLIEEEAELGNLENNTPQTHIPIDNNNVPLQRRRRLQRMLMASVAMNALLLMTCAWQYLRIRRLLAPSGVAA